MSCSLGKETETWLIEYAYHLINDLLDHCIKNTYRQLMIDHHGKPGPVGRPFRPIVGLLSGAHPRSRPARF